MRVVIASDLVGSLTSAQAGRLMADGWAGQPTTVVPLGEAGAGFGQAMADLLGGNLQLVAPPDAPDDVASIVHTKDRLVISGTRHVDIEGAPIELTTSSAGPGRLLTESLRDAPGVTDVVLDLSPFSGHDGGAGLLSALGARADVDLSGGVSALTGLGSLDLKDARDLLGGRRLVGVVAEDEADRLLLGLRGITSLRGRQAGMDAEVLLRTDAGLENLARAAEQATGVELANRPGAGAHGGLGLAVMALGGRLTTGPRLGLDLAELSRAPGSTDLVVTGCTSYDFAHRGGGVIAEAAALAAELLAPCIVLAGEVLIGAREMRTMGVEAAYPVQATEAVEQLDSFTEVDADALSALARRVARSWSW